MEETMLSLEFAIEYVARERGEKLVCDVDDPEEFAALVEAVMEGVAGFGATEHDAVEDMLYRDPQCMPDSDESLTLGDVVDILKQAQIVEFRHTPYGVLIIDNN